MHIGINIQLQYWKILTTKSQNVTNATFIPHKNPSTKVVKEHTVHTKAAVTLRVSVQLHMLFLVRKWRGGVLQAVSKPGRFIVDPQLEPVVQYGLVHRGKLVSHGSAAQVLRRQD